MNEKARVTVTLKPAADLKGELARLKKTLPEMFAQLCTRCGAAKKVRQDVFLNRVEKCSGDSETLMKHYHCTACRKAHNVDLIGRPKIAGGSTKVITIEDLIDKK